MDRKQRRQIAKSAILNAEVREMLETKEWNVVVEDGKAFVEMPGEERQLAENVIAGLLVEIGKR